MTVAEAGLSYIADTIIQFRYVGDKLQHAKGHAGAEASCLRPRQEDTPVYDNLKREWKCRPPSRGREGILSGSPRAMMRVRRAKEFFE